MVASGVLGLYVPFWYREAPYGSRDQATRERDLELCRRHLTLQVTWDFLTIQLAGYERVL